MIRVQSLSVMLNNLNVLSGLDATFEEGSRSLIAGENGAGKTTLLKAILGLVPYQSGSISVMNTLVGTREWRKLKRVVGYVEQERTASEFPATAYEVALIGACELPGGRRERHDVVDRAMELAGCSHLASRLYISLSGGEKQRVAIARCLSQQAKGLLLDEPSSSLDPEAKEGVLTLIERLNEDNGITIIMVCHDERSARRSGWLKYRLDSGSFRAIS